MKRIVAISGLSFLIIAAALFAQSTSGTGQIQGKLISDDGSAIANARVSAYRIIPAPSISSSATAAKDGTYSLSGLATGKYQICVVDGAGVYINPCQWAALRTTVDLIDGKITSGVITQMKKAASVDIRITDTAQVLAKQKGERASPHVLVGLAEPNGVFHPAAEVTHGATTVYTVNLPVDSPERLTVYSATVKLEDPQHAPVPAQGYFQMIVQPSGHAQMSPLIFKTTGRNP